MINHNNSILIGDTPTIAHSDKLTPIVKTKPFGLINETIDKSTGYLEPKNERQLPEFFNDSSNVNQSILSILLEVLDLTNNSTAINLQVQKSLNQMIDILRQAISELTANTETQNQAYQATMNAKLYSLTQTNALIKFFICVAVIVATIIIDVGTLGAAAPLTTFAAIAIGVSIFATASLLFQAGASLAVATDKDIAKKVTNDELDHKDNTATSFMNDGLFGIFDEIFGAKVGGKMNEIFGYASMLFGSGGELYAGIKGATKEIVKETEKKLADSIKKWLPIVYKATDATVKLSGIVTMQIAQESNKNGDNNDLNGYAATMMSGLMAISIYAIMHEIEKSVADEDKMAIEITQAVLIGATQFTTDFLTSKSLMNRYNDEFVKLYGNNKFILFRELLANYDPAAKINQPTQGIISGVKRLDIADEKTDISQSTAYNKNITELIQKWKDLTLNMVKSSSDSLKLFESFNQTVAEISKQVFVNR